MILRTSTLAEEIIRKSDREHPADAVLRSELKSRRDLSPEVAREVSRMVFSYFRWRGWLEEGPPGSREIERALTLADAFARKPQSISDSELVARVVPSWVKGEVEVTRALARALQTEPRLWLRARPGQGRTLAERLGDCRALGAGPLSDALEYVGRQDLFRTPEFHSGEMELQDISSQAVGWICAPEPGETWWDACAGEGGKTLHISDLMMNKGLIWATDRAEWRLRTLRRRAARAEVYNYRTALWDGRSKLPTKTKFDGVLVDAPCSGTGTWQRNPHARWTVTLEDVKELSERQGQLLAAATAAVKPGGKLIYAVCTLARSETIAVVEAFEARFKTFQPRRLANPLKSGLLPTGRLFLWPQDVQGNGMFIATWTRGA